MARTTNVFRRGTVHYFRVRVPLALRTVVGRKELWRSLKTCKGDEEPVLGPAKPDPGDKTAASFLGMVTVAAIVLRLR